MLLLLLLMLLLFVSCVCVARVAQPFYPAYPYYDFGQRMPDLSSAKFTTISFDFLPFDHRHGGKTGKKGEKAAEKQTG
jgi:hypothetical protein